MKTSIIKLHCENTPAQYWSLKCLRNGHVIEVHTSKTYSYILERQRDWLEDNA